MRKLAFTAAALMLATPAMAHTGDHYTSGFLAGVGHPIGGLDHVLAMVAVGLWSGFVLPRRVWAGAATFMGAMTLGAGMSWAGIPLPMVETWITLSVVVFGLLTLISHRGQRPIVTGLSLAAIGLFAASHGHAHASEASGAAVAYLAGFLVSTAVLHLSGIALARFVANGAVARAFQRLAGATVTLGGLWLLVG
ncbi:MAG: HupE/UreJ family protein [Rhodobacterales bacterium]|nr:HupE/UreJ family protein [Rhodobacterales bacterium]